MLTINSNLEGFVIHGETDSRRGRRTQNTQYLIHSVSATKDSKGVKENTISHKQKDKRCLGVQSDSRPLDQHGLVACTDEDDDIISSCA